MIDLNLSLTCALASSAAYELDAATRLAELNAAGLIEDSYVVGDDDARALICHDVAGQRYLAFQGTQFSQGEIPSIFANLQVDPFRLPDGALVHSGYWGQLSGLLANIPGDPGMISTGHSMGGAIAHLDQRYNIRKEVVTFGAPKCGDGRFWAAPMKVDWLRRFVNCRDMAPLWPILPAEFVQPFPQTWLHDGMAGELTGPRPVTPDCVDDHWIENYIAAIRAALAAPAQAAA